MIDLEEYKGYFRQEIDRSIGRLDKLKKKVICETQKTYDEIYWRIFQYIQNIKIVLRSIIIAQETNIWSKEENDRCIIVRVRELEQLDRFIEERIDVKI